jgi:transcription elongation factor GreB
MNTANSTDSEDGAEEEVPRGRSAYITRAGAEAMRDELKVLLTVERPKVTAEVTFAASLGDRSENAEYIYGKKRLREIDKRLRFLQKRLESLTVVDSGGPENKDKVAFGATVVLLNEEDATQVSYQLVGPDETDVKAKKISIDSPIGRALLSKRKGDTVIVMRPKGEVELTILDIVYGA